MRHALVSSLVVTITAVLVGACVIFALIQG